MKKLNKVFYISIIIILLFVIVCFIFGFKNILNFFIKYNAPISSFASIATCLGLIYTIYFNAKNHSKEIESARIASNQLEFEKRVYDILCIYDDLISDLFFSKIELDANNKEYVKQDSLDSLNDLYIKYGYALNNVHDRIFFFYREMNSNHPCLDSLIKDIEEMNTAITLELKHYSDLCGDGINLNRNYSNKMIEMKNNLDHKTMDELYNELSRIMNKKYQITSSIIDIISKKKSLLYQEAASCIEERADIIKNKN